MKMHRKLIFGAAVALAAVVAATLASGAGASAAEAGTHLDSSSVQRTSALAMAITVAEARARFGRQYALGREGARIEMSLAGRTGGSYLDTNGNLVVTTLDQASADLVRRRGARAQHVNDSSLRLDSIMNQLDRQASDTGAGAVQDWYVDVPGNTVVMTVTKGASDASTAAMTKLATSFGRSVRIEYGPAKQAPRPANYLVGGLEFVEPDASIPARSGSTRSTASIATSCSRRDTA
jgi:streptogrisin C